MSLRYVVWICSNVWMFGIQGNVVCTSGGNPDMYHRHEEKKTPVRLSILYRQTDFPSHMSTSNTPHPCGPLPPYCACIIFKPGYTLAGEIFHDKFYIPCWQFINFSVYTFFFTFLNSDCQILGYGKINWNNESGG